MSTHREGIPDYWFGFVVDTLKQLDAGIQGAFLNKLLRGVVGRELTEQESIIHWEGILARQGHLAAQLGRSVTFRTAAVDYFEDLGVLRNPVLVEYGELKKLRHDAATDALTGLANRRMFEEFLEQGISRSTRYASSFALVLLDLRNFKSVNDVCGHATGDEILRRIASVALETVRGSDIVCRVGGDEFTILLPRAERHGSGVLVERIARKLEERTGSLAPGVSIGIDYGVAIFPEDGHDAASLLAAADRHLYASKQKVRPPSANHAVAPQAATGRGAESSPPVKVEEASPDEPLPPRPIAPAARAKRGEEVQIFENAPSGRRFDRIRLEGAPALGVVRIGEKSASVKVLDASRGGVCLLLDQMELPDTFTARLQVPMLPEGELILRRIYALPLAEGKLRVGCAFTSILGLSTG